MTPSNDINVPAEFSDIPFGEKLILWAVRFWVQSLKQEANTQEILRTGFQHAGAPRAHPALDDLMTVIATSAECSVDVRCPKCPSISADEQRLMGAIAAWQHDVDPSAADAFLSAWLPSAALRIARTPTAQLAQSLKCAGLVIRRRSRVAHTAPKHVPHENDVSRAVTVH